jgi:hypothetical protein
MNLLDTITLFSRVNADLVLSGRADFVLTFSSDPEVVEYYTEQMENLEFNELEIEEFRAWLLALKS